MKLNTIVIISGPSGAGEDSVIEGLGQNYPIKRIVTTTTRSMREGEAECFPYHFVSTETFKEKIAKKEMVEWAKGYNDNLYGVEQKELLRIQQMKGLGIWKLEYKGVVSVQKIYPEIISILITAPLDILEKRIRARSTPTEIELSNRMEYTKEWLKHTDIYDYIVENKQGLLGETISEVVDILRKEQYL